MTPIVCVRPRSRLRATWWDDSPGVGPPRSPVPRVAGERETFVRPFQDEGNRRRETPGLAGDVLTTNIHPAKISC